MLIKQNLNHQLINYLVDIHLSPSPRPLILGAPRQRRDPLRADLSSSNGPLPLREPRVADEVLRACRRQAADG